MTAMASGSTRVSSKVSAMTARKKPLPASWLMKATLGPPVWPGRLAERSAMPMTTGNTATTASSAWLRRRPNTMRSSDRKKHSHGRGPARATWTFAVDLEPFPGRG